MGCWNTDERERIEKEEWRGRERERESEREERDRGIEVKTRGSPSLLMGIRPADGGVQTKAAHRLGG